jgi:hypothetical protein
MEGKQVLDFNKRRSSDEEAAIENIKKELDRLPPLPDISSLQGFPQDAPVQNVQPAAKVSMLDESLQKTDKGQIPPPPPFLLSVQESEKPKKGFFSNLFSKKTPAAAEAPAVPAAPAVQTDAQKKLDVPSLGKNPAQKGSLTPVFQIMPDVPLQGQQKKKEPKLPVEPKLPLQRISGSQTPSSFNLPPTVQESGNLLDKGIQDEEIDFSDFDDFLEKMKKEGIDDSKLGSAENFDAFAMNDSQKAASGGSVTQSPADNLQKNFQKELYADDGDRFFVDVPQKKETFFPELDNPSIPSILEQPSIPPAQQKPKEAEKAGAKPEKPIPVKNWKELKQREKKLTEKEKNHSKKTVVFEKKNKVLEGLVSRLETDKEELEKREDELIELVKQLEFEKSGIEPRRNALQKIEEDIKAKKDAIDAKDAELAAKELELKDFQRQVRDAQLEIMEQKTSLEEQAQELEKKREEFVQMSSKIDKGMRIVEENKSLSEELVRREKKLAEREKAVQNAQKELSKFNAAKAEMKRMEDEYARVKERLKSEYRKLEEVHRKNELNKSAPAPESLIPEAGFAGISPQNLSVTIIPAAPEPAKRAAAAAAIPVAESQPKSIVQPIADDGSQIENEINSHILNVQNLLKQEGYEEAVKEISEIMGLYAKLPDTNPKKKLLYYTIINLRNDVKLALVS